MDENKPREKEISGLDIFSGFLLGMLIISLIICIIILASVPPVSKDALTHHLAVPKLYLQHGGIYQIPFMRHSYYPINLDLLYLIPLYFGNDIAPKYIHFTFALLTGLLIFAYLRRRINSFYGLLGVILFLSIPVIVKLSTTVYVDLGLIFFSTAALVFLLKWVEDNFRMRHLVFSAIFCGLAMGTKYNGLVGFFLLTLFVPFLYSRHRGPGNLAFARSVGYGAIFFLIALIFFSPWMIKNWLWTGNPIFPLYDSWFNPHRAVSGNPLGIFAYRSLVYGESWWQIALLPVRIFFQGQDGNPQYFDGRLNPFLLFLPFFAFYPKTRDSKVVISEKKILLVFACLFFAFAFFSRGMRIRYISPILPPLAILSIFGIKNILDGLKNLNKQPFRKLGLLFFGGGIIFALAINAQYIVSQFRKVDPLSYLNGSLTRDEYIDKYRFEYPAMRYINKNLKPDAKILFVFIGSRNYYCDRQFIFDNSYNRSMLRWILNRSDSPEDIARALRKNGITHLLIRYDVFDPWVRTNFTSEKRKMLGNFFKKYVELIYAKWGYGVSRLK